MEADVLAAASLLAESISLKQALHFLLGRKQDSREELK